MSELVINKYLDELVRQGASDMYLTVGCPPSIRMNNHKILPIAESVLNQAHIDKFITELLSDKKIQEFHSHLEFNMSLKRDDGTRFRFNFFRQQQQSGIVIRRISTHIPTIEELGLPEIYAQNIMKKRGLIILASPSGSGKSTSMAAMVGHRNLNGSGHILTIEDPIEFVHQHKSCIVTQREVGADTASYHSALKNALRQRADVIVIGEIRDRESMEHALKFAETGHLCLATLHSNNSALAIDRMVNFFPEDTRSYVLSTLSHNLLAVFSQRLVHNLEGNNSLAFDILLNEGLVKNLILEGKVPELREAIERSSAVGMCTFDQCLLKLFAEKKISMDTAISESDHPSALKLKISQDGLAPSEIARIQQEKKDSF